MSERVILKNYFTPVDQFLKNVMEKYDSLAMTCPRIHTPFDMVRWSDIKSDIGKQFDFFRDVKDFYLTYLQDESLSDFNYFFSKGHYVNTIYDARGIHKTLTSHVPVFGKWMKNSGLLKNIKQTNVQDLDNYVEKYDDFKNIFDKEGPSVNKKRDCLFPTFDAAVTKNIFLNNGIYETSYDFLTTKEKIHITDGGWEAYVKPEKAFFSVIPTDYDIMDILEKAIPIIEDSNEKTPVLMRINDDYKKRNKEEEGFLGCDIRAAYHMNFDLHARFKAIRNIESPIQSEFSYKRIRDINERIEDDNVVIGRILPRHEYLCKNHDMIYHKGIFEGDYLIQKWDKFPIFIQDFDVYERKNCVYSNFEDYFKYDNTISEITRKFNTNYFAFMYGALPANDLTYEDIRSGLGHNSVINLDNSQGNFTVEKKKRINWTITELPSKDELEYYLKISKSSIQFLALVFSIPGKTYELSLYYLDDVDGVKDSKRKITTLSRPYPNFLILDKKPEENEKQDKGKRDDKTQVQKDDLKNKMIKIIGDWKEKSSFDKEDIIFMANNTSRMHNINEQDRKNLLEFKEKLGKNGNLDEKDKGILTAIAGRISLGGGDSLYVKKEDKTPSNENKQSDQKLPDAKKSEDKPSEYDKEVRTFFDKLKNPGERDKITMEEMKNFFFKIDWSDNKFKDVKNKMSPMLTLKPEDRKTKDEWKKFVKVLDDNKNFKFPGAKKTKT